jgi:hypothetical protein
MVTKCWQITPQPLRHAVFVRYWGATSTAALVASLEDLERVMPRERTTLVVDVRELVGHNPDSRHLWQDFMASHKASLEAVYVIVPRAWAIHRMVATVMGLAVGIRMRLVESPDEIA